MNKHSGHILMRTEDIIDLGTAIEVHIARQTEIIRKGEERWAGKDQSKLQPCKHCPTVYDEQHGVVDPEAEQLLADGMAEPFYCGWRPGVWCVAWKKKCEEQHARA